MRQYAEIVSSILHYGEMTENRTGVRTLTTFGETFKYHMYAGDFPLLTTKKMPFKSIVAELLWFLSGKNNIPENLKPYLRFWDPWVRHDGTIPSAYGYFWRNYPTVDGHFDQISTLIKHLKKDPTSRRGVVLAWEPYNACNSTLPPCHYTFAVTPINGKLHLHWTQRSCDVGLGLPFNIASYGLLQLLLSHAVNMQPGTLQGTLINAHIYENHIEELRKQISLKPYDPPGLIINYKDSIFDYTLEDFELVNYKSYPKIYLEPAV